MLENQIRWLPSFLSQACLLFTLTFSLVSCASDPALTQENSYGKEKAKPKGLVVNRGLYMINSTVITKKDITNMEKKLRSLGKKKRLRKKALDSLVERALVESEAEKNSIIISEERIKKEIEKRAIESGLSPEFFRKRMETELGLPFSEWVKELRYKLIKRQLIQIGLNIDPPSLREVKRFYYKNRHRIGIELSYREMLFVPQSSSLKEERRIASIAKSIYNKLRRNPEDFAKLSASPHNQSPYKKRGGIVPYQSIYDIARINPILASFLYRNPPGRLSPPFRDSLRRYTIIKVEKRRPLPFSKVKHLILNQLYAKREDKAFSKWIAKKRKETKLIPIP